MAYPTSGTASRVRAVMSCSLRTLSSNAEQAITDIMSALDCTSLMISPKLNLFASNTMIPPTPAPIEIPGLLIISARDFSSSSSKLDCFMCNGCICVDVIVEQKDCVTLLRPTEKLVHLSKCKSVRHTKENLAQIHISMPNETVSCRF